MKSLKDFDVLEAAPGKMRTSVQEAVDAADHLAYSDSAEVELAFQLADIIDTARASGDQAAIDKTSFGAMPSLHKVLTSLGLNPEGRQKLGLDSDDADDEW